jgi:hypothetical protein
MPQLVRLVPLLDRFNNGVSVELITGLQQGVGDLNDSHNVLVSQLRDQNLRLATIEGKLEEMKLEAARLQEHIDELQERYSATEMRLGLLLALVVLLFVVNAAVLAVFLFYKR